MRNAVSFPRARLIIPMAGAGGITSLQGYMFFSWARDVKEKNHMCTLPGSLAIIFFSAFIWRFFIFWKGTLEETDPAWCAIRSDVWVVNSEPGQLMLPDPCLMECSVLKGGWCPGKFLHGALPFLLHPYSTVVCRVFIFQNRGRSDNPV